MDLLKDFYTGFMSLREEDNPGPNQPNSRRRRRTRRGSRQKEVKWLKHYSSDHRILLVGEGDFSFSLSLAMAFGGASNIVATSLDSYDVVIKKYKGAKTNLEILHSLGAELLHEVDALQMKLHTDLQMQKFDRIIFNFPHAGFLGDEHDKRVIKKHRNLVCGFFKNASGMLRPKGEVHVAHKASHPFESWNIEELATQNSLTLLERIKFKLEDYPGYNNKRGDGKRADTPFPLGECSTYKFVLFSKGTKKNRNRRLKDGLTVRVSKEGSVITCKNEPVAPPPKIAKKKGRQRMIWKLKVDMEIEGSQTVGGPRGQTVGGQVGPRGQTVGVPMPSASEMAKKTAATKHNLVVDSGSQIGAAKPSQQVTPKNKQQTGQQQPPRKLLKIKPTATIQTVRRSPRLLEKTGTTSASVSKTTATPPKKRTPSERIVKKKLSMHVDGPGSSSHNAMTL